MSGGYQSSPSDAIGELRQELGETRRRLDELERPTGSQVYDTLATIRALVEGLIAQTEVNVTGSVTAGGNVSAGGIVTGASGIRSAPVYANLLTVSHRSVYVSSVTGPGDFGYVPSSRRFKRDEAPSPDVRAAVLAMQVVTFRYDQAVELLGDDAEVEWGVIAEDLHELGLTWAVDYDEDGLPFGVRYERLVLGVIPIVQDHERRLNAAGI